MMDLLPGQRLAATGHEGCLQQGEKVAVTNHWVESSLSEGRPRREKLDEMIQTMKAWNWSQLGE